MFFGWEEVVAFWLAFGGIWSVALIALLMVVGQLSLNKLKTPTDIVQRRNYKDSISNANLGKTNLRRFAEASRMLVINFIIVVSFLVILYKIFS
jgi:hypothetical protein